jgi:hydroxyacylglutathione hydrolase
MSLVVHTISAFTDNYIWLFHPEGDNRAYVVDPGDAEPVLEALHTLGLSLEGILITHHHPDHVGGINQLLQSYPVPVYGPKGITQVTTTMNDGDTLTVANQVFDILAIPGHTLDHIAYFSASEPLVFCGDTLFSNGCGRLFEGTPKQMWQSLSRLSSLPDETKVYCAHEYTEANTRFALTVEPENDALQQRAKDIERLRKQNMPTIPSTIEKERATNPFLRANRRNIQETAKQHDNTSTLSETETFAAIRRWKDSF